VNSRHQSSLIINSNLDNSTCSPKTGTWLINVVGLENAIRVVTLEVYVDVYQSWRFLGHLGRAPRIGFFGGPSFTWRLVGLGNGTYAFQNAVQNNLQCSYLSLNETRHPQLVNSSDSESAQWIVEGIEGLV
jgi:hypothetical protein